MIGEIRDLETGGIAIKAALTGHLVLSTLHTNDAPSTITRMIDMGIEAVQRGQRRKPRRGTAIGPPHLQGLQGAGTSTPDEQLPSLGTDIETASDDSVHEGNRLRHLQRDRLQGPGRPLRGHGPVSPSSAA